MIQKNGQITLHHEGKEITFDDLEVQELDRVEHSVYFECRGFDKDGKEYSGLIEKCCGEYECITDIEILN